MRSWSAAYHSKEVVESIDERGLLVKLLLEGIAQVMRRVRGDDQDALSYLREQRSNSTRASSLTDSSFAAYKDPSK